MAPFVGLKIPYYFVLKKCKDNVSLCFFMSDYIRYSPRYKYIILSS
ncbi:unnamed protein product [Spirodela intermedia]|uniref:Uncharacterized protein n=1 Tax=Spirodela intermedia TaxID=51605 RepID=A0A7I8IAG4_SPIIN|nr:unnamed protein product [Spirodela intermedia]CAA6653871.1 unnamed protein product [Spirodela intermedia]